MPIDPAKLPEFLKSRRWFGGKAWPIKHARLLDHGEFKLPGHDVLIGVVEVQYQLGTPERYLMPVRIDPAGNLIEALDDDAFAQALLSLIREGRSLKTGTGEIRGERLPGAEKILSGLSASPKVRRPGVEQTNTSLFFEDRAILKVIRKLEAGINPELDIGRFLATRTKFRATPPLLGYLQMTGAADATIGLLHEFVPAEADGWTWVLGQLRAGPDKAFLQAIHQLGGRMAEMHVALASDREDPAFAPEPIHKEDLDRWSSSIIGELGVTVSQTTDAVPWLTDRRARLTERAKRLTQVEPSGLKTRIHGDLHLGQVLRTKTDWWVIDFEGEPARSYVQRREKHTPLKDVAGMLRSFAYAAAAVELEGAPKADRAAAPRAAFLEGYLATARGAGFLPKAEDVVRTMLDVLELEKALYELRYEVAHRPDWVRIPAHTLQSDAP